MTGKSSTLRKKTIIAIVVIIALLFIAGILAGIFLADRGETEAVDGNQIAEEGQTGENNDEQPGNTQEQDDNSAEEPGNTDNEEDTQQEQDNSETTEENTNNNQTTGNNDNNENTSNTQVTTGTDVNEVGETTITRVEEEERLVSRSYWDWWTPTEIAIASTVANIDVEAPDLTVEKYVKNTRAESPNLVYAGDTITYVIAITNNGTKAVENIEVTDKIPENTTFESLNAGDEIKEPEKILDENNNAVLGLKWIVTVEPNQTVEVSFTVKVNDNFEGTIVNTAIANGEESEETHTAIIKNEKSSVIMRDGKEVQIAKEGDKIIYTITVENTGDISGETLIYDTVPEGTSLVSAEGAKISKDEKTGKTTLFWSNVNVPALQDGGKATVQFTVKIDDINKEIKNIATVGGNQTDENEVPTADVEVVKDVVDIKRDGVSIGKDAKVKVGDIIEYSITVTNTGSVDLTNVVVDEQLEGINVDSKDLQIATLAVGETKTITATYTVTQEKDIQGNSEQTITNKVVVTGDMPTDPENPEEPEKVEDEDEEVTPVEETPQVSVVKVADKTENVKAGETINYTITVKNTGNVTLEKIPVVDTITTSNGTFNLTVYSDKEYTTEITEIESLGVGETVELYAKYTVTQGDIDAQATISNIATATVPGEDPTESDPEETTPEAPVPGISVVKEATEVNGNKITETTKVRPEDVIEYKITVDNTGNTTLKNILVTDSLKVTVNNEVKEINDETGVSTIATIDSLAPNDTPVEIKAYYTVTETDITNLDFIYNVATATVPNGPTDDDFDNIVPINPDTSVSGTKTWIDGEKSHDNAREITLTLTRTANGKSEIVSATPEWNNNTYTFSKLPTYDAEGYEYTYSVTEAEVEGYESSIVKDEATGNYNITNTIIDPEDKTVSGTKTWIDGEKPHNNAEEITLTLTRTATGKT